jgi:nucleotide-binding universal stress UspA family protein
MVTLKRIVVATDFGEAADVAFAYGCELARTFGASLDVLHVADNVLARGYAGEGFMAAYPDLQRDVEAAAAKRLDALVSDEDRAVLNARTVVRVSTSPPLAIVDYAREAHSDLIIMGTHGRGAMAHLLMGSVAERVVRTAPCPVLTVRHPEHEFVLPDALVAVAKT